MGGPASTLTRVIIASESGRNALTRPQWCLAGARLAVMLQKESIENRRFISERRDGHPDFLANLCPPTL